MSTEDLTVFIDSFVHFPDISHHLRGVSLEKSSNSSDKQSISSKGARLWLKDSDFLALYGSFLWNFVILSGLVLQGKKAINGMTFGMARNMQSFDLAFSDAQVLIDS